VIVTTKNERNAYLFTAVVNDTSRLWGATTEKIWIDSELLLPLYVEQMISSGEVVHYVKYEEININSGLEEKDFKP
jgi:outer membrane lipoprotein-sorting protein